MFNFNILQFKAGMACKSKNFFWIRRSGTFHLVNAGLKRKAFVSQAYENNIEACSTFEVDRSGTCGISKSNSVILNRIWGKDVVILWLATVFNRMNLLNIISRIDVKQVIKFFLLINCEYTPNEVRTLKRE